MRIGTTDGLGSNSEAKHRTMSIQESDIAILIPTYKYRDKVVRAVRSALASGAGEIIVVDDCSNDGTLEALACFNDPRLQVTANDRNYGLWENHLLALQRANRPWIKFLQADDHLLPSGLRQYAAVASHDVSIVSGTPVMYDHESGRSWQTYSLNAPVKLTWSAFFDLSLRFGNFVGTPSYVMLRADAIERDPELWRRNISADMVVGAIAASKGLVAVLPAGAICHGVHPLQDAKTQRSALSLDRAARSFAYLRAYGNPQLRDLANFWNVLSFKPHLRTLARGLLRREARTTQLLDPAWRLVSDMSQEDWSFTVRNIRALTDVWSYRRSAIEPFDLDAILQMNGYEG